MSNSKAHLISSSFSFIFESDDLQMEMGEGKCAADHCLCVPLERRMKAIDGDSAQHTQFGQHEFALNMGSPEFLVSSNAGLSGSSLQHLDLQ